MGKKSPMQLSLDYLAKQGYSCTIVEHWNSFARKRFDAFGIADILAYKSGCGTVLVQTTSWNNFSARKNKILESPHHKGWTRAGGRILLHAWGCKGLREEEL